MLVGIPHYPASLWGWRCILTMCCLTFLFVQVSEMLKLNDSGETFRCPLHDDHAIPFFHALEGFFNWLETFSSFPLIFVQAEYVTIFPSPFFVNVQLARRKIIAPQREQECFPLEGSFQRQCFVNRLFFHVQCSRSMRSCGDRNRLVEHIHRTGWRN